MATKDSWRDLDRDLGVFLGTLQRKMTVWKRRTSGNAGARRHARALRRAWVRRFKHRTGLTQLPAPVRPMTAAPAWMETPIDSIKLVLLPDDTAVDGSTQRRRGMRRALAKPLGAGRDVSFELINGVHAIKNEIPDVASLVTDARVKLRGIYLPNLGAAVLPGLNQKQIDALREQGARVIDNVPLTGIMPHDDPDLVPEQDWHRHSIQLDKAHAKGLQGYGVRIGILDSGIDGSHPDFVNSQVSYRAFYPRGSRNDDQTCRDFGDHGTHVAGLCGGSRGVAPAAKLVVAAVLNEKINGQLVAYPAQIAAAIEWMLEPADGQVKRVDVINASLGSALEESKDYRAVMRTARNIAGIVTVAAIGNDGAPAGRHLAPAALDFVVAVGAVDHRDEIYVGSAWGPGFDGQGPVPQYKPDLVAPGVAITSAKPANPQGKLAQRMTGTSQATPLVTGAAALLIGRDPSLRADPDRLVAKLLSLTYSSQLLPHYGVPERFGVGRLDLGNI